MHLVLVLLLSSLQLFLLPGRGVTPGSQVSAWTSLARKAGIFHQKRFCS